jgi:prepilin-type N-terminal cleavage/methylation domain-containing protein
MWNRKNAFSLLEVLVATSLLALILAFIFRGFINFSQNSQKSENVLYLSRELNALKKLIEKDLRSVIFLQAYTNDYTGQSIRYFSGIRGDNKLIGENNADQIFMHVQREALSFNKIPADEDPKLHEVGYFVSFVEEDSYELYRSEQYYIDSKAGNYIGTISKENISENPNSKNALITKNILEFNVRYLTHSFLWVDFWNSISNQNSHDPEKNRGRIPRAVEVEIAVKRNNVILKDSFQINLRPLLAEDIYWGNF